MLLMCGLCGALVACGRSEPEPVVEPEPPVVEVLGEQQATIQGLSVFALLYEQEGEKMYLLDYETPEAALADAAKVARDGSSIDGYDTDWEGPVHFFVHDKRIAIYVGPRAEIVESLAAGAGPRFAGRDE